MGRWLNEDPARRREIGRRGGKATRLRHQRVGRPFSGESAREAGRKGGKASAAARACKACGRVPKRGSTCGCAT